MRFFSYYLRGPGQKRSLERLIQYLIWSAITDSFFDYLSSVSFASAFEHADAFDDYLQWSSVSVFCLFSLSAEGEIHAEQVVKKNALAAQDRHKHTMHTASKIILANGGKKFLLFSCSVK